jgi:hypothetical protein
MCVAVSARSSVSTNRRTGHPRAASALGNAGERKHQHDDPGQDGPVIDRRASHPAHLSNRKGRLFQCFWGPGKLLRCWSGRFASFRTRRSGLHRAAARRQPSNLARGSTDPSPRAAFRGRLRTFVQAHSAYFRPTANSSRIDRSSSRNSGSTVAVSRWSGSTKCIEAVES